MMLDQAWDFLSEQLQSNQFLAGGAVLGIIGGVVAGVIHFFKSLPGKIAEWIAKQIFIEVEIEDRDEAFVWMARWLAVHPYGQNRARKLMVLTERPSRKSGDRDHRPRVIFTPARGRHWFMYRGRFVALKRGRDENGTTGGDDLPSSKKGMFKPECMTIKILGRSRKVAQQLLDDARELSHPKGERRTAIMAYRYGDWGSTVERRPRPIESVILKRGIMEEVVCEIDKFLKREQWYIDRGIPYRLGIEFYGPPGSGKSSAIAAIAAHFEMDLAILNMSGGCNDSELRNLLADVPDNCMVMIEDIDCVFIERQKANQDDNGKVTFSGLLNAIDGVAAGEGRILFMTTNKHELLDAALIRPGRVDLQYEIGAPDPEQAIRIFQRFFPEATDSNLLAFIEAIGDPAATSMAALQGLLLKYSHDMHKAIERAGEVRKADPVGKVISEA